MKESVKLVMGTSKRQTKNTGIRRRTFKKPGDVFLGAFLFARGELRREGLTINSYTLKSKIDGVFMLFFGVIRRFDGVEPQPHPSDGEKGKRCSACFKETVMENEKVMTSRGEVVAIGEFKILKSDEFSYEIPRLSYIVIKEDENTYASTCIDLHVDGDGTTPDGAIINMRENVCEFLSVNFANNRGDGPAWDYLKELAEIDENTKEIWDAVSRYKLDLAKEGKQSDVVSEMMERVSALMEEIDKLENINTDKEKKIKQLEKEKQKIQELAEGILQFSMSQQIKYFELYSSSWSFWPEGMRKTLLDV